MSGRNQEKKNESGPNLIVAGLMAVAGAILWNGTQNRNDNERQREHERDMAEVGLGKMKSIKIYFTSNLF